MCAARAIAQRQLEALEARLGFARVIGGGDSGLPPNVARVEHTTDARQNTESVHLLRERLRALRTQIVELNMAQDNDETVRALNEKASDLEESLDTVSDDLLGSVVATVDKLRTLANKMSTSAQPKHCGICFEGFEGADAITGKHCYDVFHPKCIAMAAFTKVQPNYVDHNNRYWRFVDYATDARGVHTPNYVLRGEFLEADGETPRGFPGGTWVDCPQCRRPYADSFYFEMVERARATIDDEDNLAAPTLAPPEQLREWRDAGHVLLVAPPDTTDVLMLVEARIPGRAAPDGFPVFPKASGVYRQCGFTWDRTGDRCGGGSAYYRARRFDDVVDDLSDIGGELRRTQPSHKKRLFEIDDGPDGRKRYEERRVLEGGGSWKFDYPRPAAEEEEAQAAADDVALQPGV
jgi:protein-arginine kinase activator protein McsA